MQRFNHSSFLANQRGCIKQSSNHPGCNRPSDDTLASILIAAKEGRILRAKILKLRKQKKISNLKLGVLALIPLYMSQKYTLLWSFKKCLHLAINNPKVLSVHLVKAAEHSFAFNVTSSNHKSAPFGLTSKYLIGLGSHTARLSPASTQE